MDGIVEAKSDFLIEVETKGGTTFYMRVSAIEIMHKTAGEYVLETKNEARYLLTNRSVFDHVKNRWEYFITGGVA